MLKKYEVKQSGYKDCGACCLLSLIRYYKGNMSLDELIFLLKTDKNGTNAYNLIECAKSIGFDGYAVRYSFDELIKSDNYPCIIHVLNNNMYHFVVLYKVNHKTFTSIIMDPSKGIVKLSFDKLKEMYLGVSIILFPVKKIYNVKETYFKSYLLSVLSTIKSKIIIISILSLISVVFSFFPSIILSYIVDNQNITRTILLFFIFSILFKYIFDNIRINRLIKVNKTFSRKINNKFFRHLFSLPYIFFKNKTTSEVVTRANDINNFKDILSSITLTVFSDLVFLILSIVFLFIINKNLFLITFLFMVLFIFVSFVYHKKITPLIKEVQLLNEEYNKNISESILSFESNKNINMLDYFNKRNEFSYLGYLNNFGKYEKIISKGYLLKDLIISITQLVIITIGILYVNQGFLSIGGLVLFNSILTFFINPVKNILDLLPNISYCKEIYNRINSLLLIKNNDFKENDYLMHGDIKIENLKFSYNGVTSILDNINMNIKYSSHVAIYSPSGYGKSTLFKILLKYLDGYEGNIYINNINIKDIDNSKISSSFTYVSQNNFLINDTLENNIKYFRNISEEEYEKVIDICHINEIRNKTKLRNNFLIEENGFNISGGERQKIILARSLLKKSNYIILDEALSEVGYKEEIEIIKNIKEYFEEKTIIYVSHKDEVINSFEEKYCLKGVEK